MKILAVANQKGGIGKSTLTAHLAYAAREAGLRVLLVDLDPQGSVSLTFQPNPTATPGLQAWQLFAGQPAAGPLEWLEDGFAIVRGTRRLASAKDLDENDPAVMRLPGATLRQFAQDFDLCLIDTAPGLGALLIAGLTAADYVVTPVSIGLYELSGVADLMQTIHVVRKMNPRLRHVGILPTKTNPRSTEERQALDALRKRYGAAILADSLPERAAVKQAVAKRRPVWLGTKGDGHMKAGREWRAACESILGRLA